MVEPSTMSRCDVNDLGRRTPRLFPHLRTLTRVGIKFSFDIQNDTPSSILNASEVMRNLDMDSPSLPVNMIPMPLPELNVLLQLDGVFQDYYQSRRHGRYFVSVTDA